MIDIVLPLGRGSKYNHELRYSLRSIEKHLKNYRNIYIIGECPDFVKDVIHIPVVDLSYRTKNIMLKVLAACTDTGVSEDFLFWNDDFFLLDNIDAVNYPYYFNLFLEDAVAKRVSKDQYYKAMVNTFNKFNNNTPFHFDIHCPIIYNKEKFISFVAGQNWDIRDGYIVKSLYANSVNIKPVQMEDCKISQALNDFEIIERIQGRHTFSVGDTGLNGPMYKVLQKFYPNRSRYEK